MERVLGYLLAAALSLGSFAAQATGDDKAADLLRQARAALGGDAVDTVKGLSASGTVKRAAGDMQIAGEMTLQLQLPDRMLRTDSLSPDGGITLVSDQGINGDTLLRATRTFNAPPGAMLRTPPAPEKGSDAETQALRAARADLARLTIALLLRAPENQPLAFTYGGTAEAPDGKADVIDVKGRDGNAFSARLFLDTVTHRPLLLSYRGVAPRLMMQQRRVERGAPPPDLSKEQIQGRGPGPGDVVEIEMFLDDYRKAGGVLLPHHVTRSVGGEVNEEWMLSAYTVNPTFKAGTFDAR